MPKTDYVEQRADYKDRRSVGVYAWLKGPMDAVVGTIELNMTEFLHEAIEAHLKRVTALPENRRARMLLETYLVDPDSYLLPIDTTGIPDEQEDA